MRPHGITAGDDVELVVVGPLRGGEARTLGAGTDLLIVPPGIASSGDSSTFSTRGMPAARIP